MTTPEISVIMPVYNAEAFLTESIESILNQTFTNFELIILNDKSTDNSLEVISKYQRSDSRIIIVNKDINVGPANLRNEGLKIAKGEFVALMDADDIALPQRFEKQINVLKQNPEIGLCGTWFTFFGSQKKLIKHSETPEAIKISFLHSCAIGNPTVMLRKQTLGDLQFENEYVPVEDYDLWSRFLLKTTFYNIPESLLDYRQHKNNISKTKIDNVNRAVKKVKINQLKRFGIESSDPKIDYYLNAVSLQKKLSPDEIFEVIAASKHLAEQNKKLNNYNQELLEKHLEKTLIRTIRNAGKYNLAFYKQLIRNEKVLFRKINTLDKAILLIKSLIG